MGATETLKVLFLAANPESATRLALDEEVRAITEKIRLAEARDRVQVVQAWAVRPDDLLQQLNQHRPHIVHFSGHGSAAGELILVDNHGQAKPVSPAALHALFRTLKDNIRLVLLNACYSRVQGEAIAQEIDFVMGMTDRIGDTSARAFAAAMYGALAFHRSVQDAFDQGHVALLLQGSAYDDVPDLLIKPGADPTTVLVDREFRTEPRSEDARVAPTGEGNPAIPHLLGEVARTLLLGTGAAALPPGQRSVASPQSQDPTTQLSLEKIIEGNWYIQWSSRLDPTTISFEIRINRNLLGRRGFSLRAPHMTAQGEWQVLGDNQLLLTGRQLRMTPYAPYPQPGRFDTKVDIDLSNATTDFLPATTTSYLPHGEIAIMEWRRRK